MLSDVSLLLTTVYNLFRIEFTLYGFTFSMWQVFLFTIVAGLVGWLISEVFFGD